MLNVQVIEVKAKHRTGKEDFIQVLQSSLSSHYGTKPIGLGGVFLLTKGKAKIHIMVTPSFNNISEFSQQ